MSVRENLATVRSRIADCTLAAGRPVDAIRLIAVSKRQPAELIREAHAAGQRDFGENYAQELIAKRDALGDLADIRWHFIGHFQARKARDMADGRIWLHGLDNLKAAERLNARAEARIPVFLQVNVGGEITKSGIAPDELDELADFLHGAPHLDWKGLMTIPPETDTADLARPYFRRMRSLRDTLSARFGRRLELSMGMSGDFEAAIAEGADYVRIGTAIFGERVQVQF